MGIFDRAKDAGDHRPEHVDQGKAPQPVPDDDLGGHLDPGHQEPGRPDSDSPELTAQD